MARAWAFTVERKELGMEKATYSPYDTADHLKSEKDIAAYLEAVVNTLSLKTTAPSRPGRHCMQGRAFP